MLEVIQAEALGGRHLRLWLSNGQVVERDVSDLMWGQVFERIRASDVAFAEVTAANGTASWPRDGADIAPETLIWNGHEPVSQNDAQAPTKLKVESPSRPPG